MAAVKRLTQRDIARLAGVSQATVSLVLNGASSAEGRIPAETRDRVIKVIRETGYVADPVARRMVKGLNRILGVFTYEPAFPSAQADFYTPFLLGIEEAAEQFGYDLLLMTGAGRDAAGRKRMFGDNSRLRLADGCLILGAQFDPDELAQLVASDYPYVAVGRRDDAGGPVRYVGADYVTATAALVERALAMGHRAFAFIGQTDISESVRDRWQGFETALQGQGQLVHLDSRTGSAPQAQLAAVRQAGASIVFFGELADAVAFDDCARASGLSVPGDLSIVALGSSLRIERNRRAFASYAIPREDMGRQATAMLIQTLVDPTIVQQTLLDCALVPGETLAPPTTTKDFPN
ncbi:MAG: LacI family DNA-binding transcriptional regulator [Devosia sp.]